MKANCRTAILLILALAMAATEAEATARAAIRVWPAIVFSDEARNIAFDVDAAEACHVELGWDDSSRMSFPVPRGPSVGLLAIPLAIGRHRCDVRIGGEMASMTLRLADVSEEWPIASLRDGLPIDSSGNPVVLVDRRHSDNEERRRRLAGAEAPRGMGSPILVGDPLASIGGDAWQGIACDVRPAVDARFPQHAALLALVRPGRPSCIVWCPGNGALLADTWSGEERLCAALARRCAALAFRPRLVLALPPWPVPPRLREAAELRRTQLAAAAQAAGWELLDLAIHAGDPWTANRVSDGLYADYPVGAAQERMRAALRQEIARSAR